MLASGLRGRKSGRRSLIDRGHFMDGAAIFRSQCAKGAIGPQATSPAAAVLAGSPLHSQWETACRLAST